MTTKTDYKILTHYMFLCYDYLFLKSFREEIICHLYITNN